MISSFATESSPNVAFGFSSVLRKKDVTTVIPHNVVKHIMGIGSSNWLITKLKAETKRAKKLHTPRAVAANKVGKKYELATKLILNVHVTPNFVSKKHTKKRFES